MRIMSKLATALRGGVRETAEIVIDANSLRIFGQEIHECENHISQSKQQLASIIAEKMRVKREIKAAEQCITRYEARILELIERNDEAAELSLAESVSEKEALLERHQQHCQKLQNHEEKLQQTLKKMVSKLENYRTELRMAKATSRMQSAQSKLAHCNDGAVTRFTDMQDSLDRIRDRQQTFADEMDAMDQIDAHLSGEDNCDPDDLKVSAKEVLERIKQKRSAA